MKYLGVNFAWAVLVTFFFFANCQTASGQESEEVCISIPRGPAGPQGPMGPPGEVIQCVCNYTDFEDEIRSQQETINHLSRKIATLEAQNRLVKISSPENETLNVSIDFEEIKEVVNEEWRKMNNCPIGLYDGRIPDYDITASSEFNNDSSTYGAHLARLNNQPKDGNIGAWKSQDVTPIRSISCSDSFYSSSGSVSSSRLMTNLVQMVRCPKDCDVTRRRYGYNEPRLYGTGVYTDFSPICWAAIHNGKIEKDVGGVVTVHRVPRKEYQSAYLYQVRSSSYTAGTGSFSFGPNDMLQWIQVDFQTPTLLTGVVTQGRPTTSEDWVETFKIQYGNNKTDLATMKNSNETDILFRGNSDRTSHVTNMFLEPIKARFVRLVAYTWHGSVSMRLEYLTC